MLEKLMKREEKRRADKGKSKRIAQEDLEKDNSYG